MEIYIQSSGVSQDYCWLKVETSQREEPRISPKAIELIDTDDYSVILERRNGNLILLVTGLETKRTDNRHRRIRNSVMWVGNESEESEIKALTVQALRRDTLTKKIDGVVISEGKYGFSILPETQQKLKELYQPSQGKKNPKSGNLSNPKFGNFPGNQEDLASEIAELELPKEYKLLVVVTQIKTKEGLKNANAKVWRGLSTLIPINQKFEYEPEENNSEAVLRERIRSLSRVIVPIALVISLSVNVLLLQQWMVQQQGIKNLESRIEILQTQKIEFDKLREQEHQQKEAALLELQQERKRYQDLLSRAQKP